MRGLRKILLIAASIPFYRFRSAGILKYLRSKILAGLLAGQNAVGIRTRVYKCMHVYINILNTRTNIKTISHTNAHTHTHKYVHACINIK